MCLVFDKTLITCGLSKELLGNFGMKGNKGV